MKRTWSQSQKGKSSTDVAQKTALNYGELGIIESVHLRNFMCHDNLSFDFDPHMNFIVGRNGSGKSAVLTAIILALGGKSGATGRFTNVKGFIKTGKRSATVSVTLKNCGEDAYKPEEYGSKITVDRHFTSEGISSYKLKSQGGHIISSSKEELINILQIMNIQIENPITVLTQEISRNFLVSKNSKADKLFQLFFRGTGLADVKDRYNKSIKDSEDMRSQLEFKKSILPMIQTDLRKLKTTLDKTNKLTELRKELLWAIAIEFEERRDETKQALQNIKKQYSDLKKILDTTEADLAKTQQSVTAIRADAKASTDKTASMRNEINDLKKKSASLRSDIQQIKGSYSSHERELDKTLKDIEFLVNAINESKKEKEHGLKEMQLKHEMNLKYLKEQHVNITSQMQMLELQSNGHREAEARLQKKMETCHAEIQEINYSMDNIMKEKQQLVDGMANRINVFGQEMVNALKEIKRAVQSRLFKVEPKGPIGLYINVKNPEWNFAVQECLKIGFLKTFICDNHADADCLTRIFNKHFQRHCPSIITAKFVSEVYDVTPHKTICVHPTLLDLLDISDPVIINCLIDQKHIENILMIADGREASSLMLHNPPKKCHFAYTPNGDQYCHTPYRNYSCRSTNRVVMFKTVNEEDIKKKEEELKGLDITKIMKLNEKKSLVEHLRKNQDEINKINSDITNLKIKLKDVNNKLYEEENNYEEPRDVNCLQSDLEQLQIEKKHQEEQYDAAKSVLDEKNEEISALDAKIKDLHRLLQIESHRCQKFNEEGRSHEHKMEYFERTIAKTKDQLKQTEPILKEQEAELANDEATLMAATKNALESCPRVNTNRSTNTVRQILKETETYVEKNSRSNRETVLRDYEEKLKHLNKSKAQLEGLEKANARLSAMLTRRLHIFKKICNNTEVSLCCCFTCLLKENHFSGYPRISFEEETLEIFAKPEKSATKLNKYSNLTQLSGGERSYVTIAFLLSLWDRINAPFRILDEYDVFMDSSNRHLSINLLVNTARAKRNIQYIFLSPLELPDIADSDHVKVHKMPAPRK